MSILKTAPSIMGLAVDEAILAGAMIGSAGLFTAVSVPWSTLFSTEMAQTLDELAAIEQANDDFYSHYRKWPHEMTDGTWTHNAAALVTQRALRYPYRNMDVYFGMLEDIPFDLQGKRVHLRHAYGNGGRIIQGPAQNNGYRMTIKFENMPLSKIKEIDEKIDGKADLDHGRLRVDIVGNRADMVYDANPINAKTARR